jgi:hypothetical protein
MPRGNAEQTKVIYKGQEGQYYVVFVDSVEDLHKWKRDSSIPLTQVVAGWKVLTTHHQGAQGIMETPSKQNLENEFGTTADEEIVKKILTHGEAQVKTVCPFHPSLGRWCAINVRSRSRSFHPLTTEPAELLLTTSK